MDSKTTTHHTGQSGESQAKAWLIDKGYIVLHTNWHWGHYELDLVAIDRDELVVVEVKTPGKRFLQDPEEAVNKGKIQRITAAANAYARYFRIDLPVRFDIITVIGTDENPQIDHLEDAFMAPPRYR